MSRLPNNMQMPPNLGLPSQFTSPYKSVAANQFGPSVKTVGKGSLVSFSYNFWGHDPSPLVIVTDIMDQYIRGVNLHYLTLPYFKKILQPNCNNPSFSYYNIKADKYITNAFRTYKRIGIKQLKTLDCDFLLKVLGVQRLLDPSQVEAMRKAIQEQLRQVNPMATKIGENYTNMIQPPQTSAGFTPIFNPPPVTPDQNQ